LSIYWSNKNEKAEVKISKASVKAIETKKLRLYKPVNSFAEHNI